MKCAAALLSFFILFALVQASKRTLVIVDDKSIETTHSIFFRKLRDLGNKLTFHAVSDELPEVHDDGVYQYEAMVVFAPNSKNIDDRLVDVVLDFIDTGKGNLLIAGDSEVNYFTSQLVEACGIEFGSNGNAVIDHLSFDQSDADGYHTLIIADNFIGAGVLGATRTQEILYRGNGMALRPENKLVFPILVGSPSSFCSVPDEEVDNSVLASGQNLALVAGLQARNGARVAISGSVAMFSDEFFVSDIHAADGKVTPAGNSEFVMEMCKWVFGERGIIRIKSIHYHVEGEEEGRTSFIIREPLVYTVEIEQFNGKEWIPYSCDDLQLEVQMLDPYIRRTLEDKGNGIFTSTFNLPDVIGVYTLKLDYHRVGYSSLSDRTLITITPVRHTDYERYIFSAYPYYLSALSMVIAVVLFSFIFLFV